MPSKPIKLRMKKEILAELQSMKKLWEDMMNYDGIIPLPKIGGTPEYWANRLDAKIQFAKWVLGED